MRRAIARSGRPIAIPRGVVIVGLALASWGLVVLASELAGNLFAFVTTRI